MSQPRVHAAPAADRVFHAACALSVALPLVFGAWFVWDTASHAWSGFSNQTWPTTLLGALAQSLRVIGLALALALPAGIGAAIHLEHLGSQGFFSTLALRAITLLAAIPSVLYGLFGLTVLMGVLGIQSLVVTASITLALFLFPVIVERTRSALQTVPPLVHEAALALGADPWRALVHVVLPLALPKLVAELLLLVARALGTAAPLLIVGFSSASAKGTVVRPLAVHIFEAVADPDPVRQTTTAASIMVLLMLVALLHLAATRIGHEGSSGRGSP